MALFAKGFRQWGRYLLLLFIICVLAGCGGTEVAGEADKPVETENSVYYIREYQTEEGIPYPQIELKGEKDIVCGAEFLNCLLEAWVGGSSYAGYQIFYADEDILSLCFWYDSESGRIAEPMAINFQCVNYKGLDDMRGSLESVQDDNACPAAPIPGNGVRISFDALLQELEKGNYELDQDADAFWQSEPELVVQSIREHLQKIRDGGLQDTYFGYMEPYKIGTRGMYLKEGRVGFFIHDFRVEFAYDWKAELSQSQVDYEVYREEGEDGTYGYLQVRGLGDVEETVNQAIWEDLRENLKYLDLDKTNEIMTEFGHEMYWRELPEIGPPRVTWQSGRYLCIRQEPLLDQSDMLRFVEEWKRYHVYDLETGRSLQLGDILNLNLEFVRWLKEEKKVEGWAEYHEGDAPGELGELLWKLLDRYSEQQLLSALGDAEFWMKEGSLYFRLPFLDQWDKPLYSYGGTSYPNYLVYAECRIKEADLAMWINEEHREAGNHSPAGASASDMTVKSMQEMPLAIHMLVGADYHIALCEDGTVWSWGDNADGKLGMAVGALRQPERIPGLENVVKIVDGGKDIFALTADGEVYYWGWGLDADSMVYTPTRLEGLGEIAALDGKNNTLFVLDKEGRLYSLGMYFDYARRDELIDVFSGREELGQDIDRIVAGAGNYHYFIRKDGTVCSIMESVEDIFSPYKFIFPAEREGTSAAKTYAVPEELDSLTILNEDTKMDHVVYYDLAGTCGVEALSADGYTVFLSKTDGTLWYWDSDRIKYHDDERALIDPESAEESCAGSFVQIDIREILNIDGETPTPRIAAMESGLECTMFLTDDGRVFVSRYETCGVEDVSCFVKANPNPGKRPSVETIEDMELKTLVFERLVIGNIVSISTDGEENFTALDADGVYYRYAAMDSEAVRAYRDFLAGERSPGREDINWLITPTGEPERRYAAWYCIWDVDGDGTPELHVLSGRDYRLYSYRDGEMFFYGGLFSRPWRNVPLESGAFIEAYDAGTTVGGYYYFELADRKAVSELRFYWTDTNENYICDEEDVFWYEGEAYTMEEWFARTGQYILLTKDGRTRVRNSVAWTLFCEEIW